MAATLGIALVLCLATAAATLPRQDAPEVRGLSTIGPTAWPTVLPSAETDPSHHPGDTADDMAIWIHPTDPSLSVVIGDDKDGGLMVWDLDGRERQYVDGNKYNNVDLRYNFPLEGTYATGEPHANVALVGVSNDGDNRFDFFKVNPRNRLLEPVGGFGVGISPYGGCMYLSVSTGTYYFLAPNFRGVVEQWEVSDGGDGQVAGTFARRFEVGNTTEGCVADDLLGHLYLAESAKAIWKYGAEPDAGDSRTLVDSTDGGNIVPEVEGLSLYYAGTDIGYLFAANQGEHTVGVYEREGDNAFLGKFSVGANGTIDAVSATDGIDVTNFPLAGPFSAGLFAIHDSSNSGANASNVKLVSYGALASALDLVIDTLWDPRLVGAPPPPPPPPPFEFAVSVDPAAGSVEPGGSLDVTAAATLISGSPQEVSFSCDDLPAGASCDFRPPSCTPPCDVSLSLQTDPTTPEGTYTVVVEASNGTVSRSAPFLLTVARPPPPPSFDFTVSVDPTAAEVEAGGSVNATVNATLVSGDSNEIAFACEDLPAGASCAFTPPACAPTCGVGLVLTTDPDTPEGTYAVGIRGSDGNVSRSAILLLTVTAPPPPPPPFDFALTVDPAEGTVTQGEALTLAVDATLVSGETHEVRFSCDGLPQGASCTFTPPSCDPTCEASLRLATDSTTSEGTYSVDVRGSDGTIARNATFRLTVVAPPPPLPVPTSLVLDPEIPDPSRPGEDVNWSASLVRNDTKGPVIGRPVVLEWSEDGGITWSPAGTGDTDAAGRANGTLAFLTVGEQRLRARFDGDAELEGSVSAQEIHTTREDTKPPPPDPSPPSANFTFAPTEPRVGDNVTFDASGSTSDPGTTLLARWDWEGDGTWEIEWSSALQATHAFAAEGTYSVVLEVRDSNGRNDTEVRPVVVRAPPVLPDTSPPTIVIVSPANESTVTSPLVTFTGTAGDDRAVVAVDLSLDGENWTRASGTATWTATLTLVNGTNTVYVRATDSSGNPTTVLIFVTVDPPDDASPDPTPKPWGVVLLLSLPPVQGTLFAVALLAAVIIWTLRRTRTRPRIPPRHEARQRAKEGDRPADESAAAPRGATEEIPVEAPAEPTRVRRYPSIEYLMEVPLEPSDAIAGQGEDAP